MQKDQKLTVEEAVDTLKRAGLPEDQMSVLERQLGADSSNPAANKDSSARAVNFVRAEVAEPEPDTTKTVANAEEIDLPESDSDDENIEIAQKSVPAAVFGELAKKVTDEQEGEDEGAAAASESQLGALERIKRQRRQ